MYHSSEVCSFHYLFVRRTGEKILEEKLIFGDPASRDEMKSQDDNGQFEYCYNVRKKMLPLPSCSLGNTQLIDILFDK